MKKDLLLQLLNEIKESEVLLSFINDILKNNFEKLLVLTDEQIEKILSFENDKLKAFQIYMYLNKTKIPYEIHKLLNSELYKENEVVYYTIPMLQNKKFLSIEDAYDIICIIVKGNPVTAEKTCELALNDLVNEHHKKFQIIGEIANCKYSYQAIATAEASLNKNLLNREDILDYLYVIARSNGKVQAKYASKLSVNIKILEKDNSLEFVKEIGYAKEEYQAENAYVVATNQLILTRENSLEFVKVVVNTKGESRSGYVKDTAICIETLKKENALSYVKAVSTAKDYQVRDAMMSATNPISLQNSNSLENVMIVGHANGIKQAQMAYLTASNETLKNRKDVNDIIKIIARAKSDIQAEKAYMTALNETLINREDMPSYVKLIANAERKNSVYAYSAIDSKLIFKSSNPLKIVELITSAKTIDYSFLIKDVVCHTELYNKSNHLEILELLENAKGDEQASIACNLAVEPLLSELATLNCVKLFSNAENEKNLFTAYNICLYIATMNQKLLEEQTGEKIVKLLLDTEDEVLDKSRGMIFINPDGTVEDMLEVLNDAINWSKKQILKERQNKYQTISMKGIFKDCINVNDVIKCVSNIEDEEISLDSSVKIKIK